MAYTTQAKIATLIRDDELLRLTDEDGSGEVEATVVDAAIEAADLEIDAYLGERFSLPLSPVPSILSILSAKMAVYNLYLNAAEGPPEQWKNEHENALKLLAKVAKGELSLGVSDPDAAGAGTPVEIASSDRIFSRDKMKGF